MDMPIPKEVQMKEITLEFNEQSGRLVAHVSNAGRVGDELIPLAVTHFTPCAKHPLLAMDPTGRIPQMIVDYLMEEMVNDDNRWWFDYYKERRDFAKKNAAALARADQEFKDEAMKKLELERLARS
jgi:hypothetical protein